MKRRLAEMQAMKAAQVEAERKVKPATEKQIEAIKKSVVTDVWRRVRVSNRYYAE
ncbi:hypothetical protein ACT7C1_26315 [Bacillus paranthracis]